MCGSSFFDSFDAKVLGGLIGYNASKEFGNVIDKWYMDKTSYCFEQQEEDNKSIDRGSAELTKPW
jgi:hypothetical protein